ncbi:hypothetical protein PVK06_044263 [Gossypium arboreum]|uniref:Protein NIM1-INTERACTING 1-like n=1 Tax=Gossypium arboreum TaxID=29729 RepID=A0ABR0MQQ1_GOSAR|nr:hypothetical protein PVK06_044263 [Gossypium arboreum]
MEREKSKAYVNGEDEEQEDEKMEEFFALIRNFQEARDKRRNELKQMETKTKTMKGENKVRRLNNNEQPSWVPSFEWADFNEEIEFRKPPIIYPTPYNGDDDDEEKQQQHDEENDGLDLKLTL